MSPDLRVLQDLICYAIARPGLSEEDLSEFTKNIQATLDAVKNRKTVIIDITPSEPKEPQKMRFTLIE